MADVHTQPFTPGAGQILPGSIRHVPESTDTAGMEKWSARVFWGQNQDDHQP